MSDYDDDARDDIEWDEYDDVWDDDIGNERVEDLDVGEYIVPMDTIIPKNLILEEKPTIKTRSPRLPVMPFNFYPVHSFSSESVDTQKIHRKFFKKHIDPSEDLHRDLLMIDLIRASPSYGHTSVTAIWYYIANRAIKFHIRHPECEEVTLAWLDFSLEMMYVNFCKDRAWHAPPSWEFLLGPRYTVKEKNIIRSMLNSTYYKTDSLDDVAKLFGDSNKIPVHLHENESDLDNTLGSFSAWYFIVLGGIFPRYKPLLDFILKNYEDTPQVLSAGITTSMTMEHPDIVPYDYMVKYTTIYDIVTNYLGCLNVFPLISIGGKMYYNISGNFHQSVFDRYIDLITDRNKIYSKWSPAIVLFDTSIEWLMDRSLESGRIILDTEDFKNHFIREQIRYISMQLKMRIGGIILHHLMEIKKNHGSSSEIVPLKKIHGILDKNKRSLRMIPSIFRVINWISDTLMFFPTKKYGIETILVDVIDMYIGDHNSFHFHGSINPSTPPRSHSTMFVDDNGNYGICSYGNKIFIANIDDCCAGKWEGNSRIKTINETFNELPSEPDEITSWEGSHGPVTVHFYKSNAKFS
jgi:hypothetical protein